MVDCVEFTLLNQIANIGYFQASEPIRLQQDRKALNEVVYRIDMGGDVVGDDHVGQLPFSNQLPGECCSEEGLNCWYATLARSCNRSRGRVYAKHRDSQFDEIAEEVAIVTRHFDD